MGETRGKGEGSIYRTGDGRWVGAIDIGRDRNGARRRRRVVRKTRAEVVKALDRLRREAEHGVVPDNTRTLASYLAWWLANVKEGRIKPTTMRFYRGCVERYIVPQLGHLKLGKITPGHVTQWLKTLEGYGLRLSTIGKARMVLGNALRHAAASHLIPANPVAVVDRLPSTRDGRLDDTMTERDATTILAAVTGDRLEALAVLALRLGMRQGELLALRWCDVDLDAEAVHVRGTLRHVPWQHGCPDPQTCGAGHHTRRCLRTCKGHADRCPQRHRPAAVVIDTPKTRGSKRTLPLVAGTADVLRAHRARQASERLTAGAGWVDSGHVFTHPDGAPLSAAYVLKWWYRLTERAGWQHGCDQPGECHRHAYRCPQRHGGVGRRRFHASRHTCATLLLAAGVPLEVVSAILGHSDLSTTADTYAKVLEDAKRAALLKLAVAV